MRGVNESPYLRSTCFLVGTVRAPTLAHGVLWEVFASASTGVWNQNARQLRRLESDAVALQVLKDMHPDAPIGALYGNAAKVATNARQAIAYEESTSRVNIEIIPLILYYGYLHWMKALLYLSDLDYPHSSSLLQHGMSVRKVKREVYRWPLDYTYVYKEGVLQSFRDIVAPDLMLPNKIPIGHLLGSIPSIADAVAEFYPEFQHIYPVIPAERAGGLRIGIGMGAGVAARGGDASGRAGTHTDAGASVAVAPVNDAYVSRRIASNIGLTPTEWIASFAAASKGKRSQRGFDDAAVPTARRDAVSPVHDRDPNGLLGLPTAWPDHPWLYNTSYGQWVGDGHAYPLWISHLVTVYVLSTLCRYNAVEWLDIVHWNNDKDAHLVREYLTTVPRFPELLDTRR